MRLFVGLVPSGESLLRIEAIAPMLLPASSRREPLSNLHLTLVFLSKFPEVELENLKKTLWQEFFQQEVPAFYLRPYRLHWQRSTLWLELKSEPRLEAVAEHLHSILGVPFRRPFRPHITLARTRSKYSSALGSYPLHIGDTPLFFPEAYLFQSHLSQEGAIYERLMRYPLYTLPHQPL